MQQLALPTSSVRSFPSLDLHRQSLLTKCQQRQTRRKCGTTFRVRLSRQPGRWNTPAEPDRYVSPRPAAGNEVDVPTSEDGSANPESSNEPIEPPPDQGGPSIKGNRILALTACTIAVGLFLAPRLMSTGPGLQELSAMAVPYEEAIRNGRPTLVEFYADWCEVCREMAGDVYAVEQEYKSKVNFVMLNVDNSKWEQELDEFGVEGIPHFAFLDSGGNEEGAIVGKLPRKFLLENIQAIADGAPILPHSRIVGRASSASNREAPPTVDPRGHSSS